MSIHSRKGSIVSENKSDEAVFVGSSVNLRRGSLSNTRVHKRLQSKDNIHLPPNVSSLMSEIIFPVDLKTIVECVSETEGIPDLGKDKRTMNTLVSELEREVAILKVENSQLESKLKQTGDMLANSKMKIEKAHSSQELNIVVGHLKQELNKVKMKNNRLKGSLDGYQSNLIGESEKSLDDSIKEMLNLQEFLDVIKCTVEPKQYNMVIEAYRQKTGKEVVTDQSGTSIECASVQFSDKQRKERILCSSRNKSGRNRKDSSSLDKSSVSVQTENTKESISVKRRKRKKKWHQSEPELQISKAENDILKSELKAKNEQIMKLAKDIEYLSTSSRRQIEESRKDIESLIKKGGENEALWARCLELKEAKESIEKQFMLYKQERSDESAGIVKEYIDGDKSECKDLLSANRKEINRETLLVAMNQINQLKVENNRLKNENRNLTLQCQHFQRLALYAQPDIVFEETRINH